MSVFERLFGGHLAAAAAEVTLDIDYEKGAPLLVLANPGRETARDISVEFDEPLVGLGGELRISEWELFRGLPVLRPGTERRVLIDSAAAFFAREAGSVIRTRVRWRDRRGRRFEDLFVHDLGIYREWPEVV